MKYAEIIFTLILALHISCKDSPSETEKILGNGRLNINGSIDSVKIGDLPERVKELLGEPQYWIEGDFDGFGYGYDFGRVTFMKIPVDSIYKATFISLNNNYEGETIEGMGIGSKRTDVLNFIRPPDKAGQVQSDSSLSYIDSYIINQNENYYSTIFFFFYDGNEILFKIDMNYY